MCRNPGRTAAHARTCIKTTAKGCASCCGGVLRYKETCYTLYDGVVLNPTDKAECE